MASHVSSCMRCLFRRDLHVKKGKEASASTVVTRVTTLLEVEFEFSRSLFLLKTLLPLTVIPEEKGHKVFQIKLQ